MKKFSFLLLLVAGLAVLLASQPDTAEARRFGSSRSFGSRPSYSQNYKSPSTFQQRPTTGMSTRSGRGMFGGLLGGMLMGGLLGSLFFGGPFMGPNLIDMLLIGGGLFLLMRFLRSRQPAEQMQGRGYARSQEQSPAWEQMRSATAPAEPSGPTVPPGFDTEDFLTGAKAAYMRLQTSWDARDMGDIRQFTSDEVFAEVAQQASADPAPGKTEILMLEAQLLEVKTLGNQTIATVLFDAMLREDGPDSSADQVREAWHFSRYETGNGQHWVVEGLQQVTP